MNVDDVGLRVEMLVPDILKKHGVGDEYVMDLLMGKRQERLAVSGMVGQMTALSQALEEPGGGLSIILDHQDAHMVKIISRRRQLAVSVCHKLHDFVLGRSPYSREPNSCENSVLCCRFLLSIRLRRQGVTLPPHLERHTGAGGESVTLKRRTRDAIYLTLHRPAGRRSAGCRRNGSAARSVCRHLSPRQSLP